MPTPIMGNYRIPPNVESKVKPCQESLKDTKAPQNNECTVLQSMGGGVIETRSPRDNERVSIDGQISCWEVASYTIDYEQCIRVLKLYDGVLLAEKALDLQQKVRTDFKNQNLQKEISSQSSNGNLQKAATDAAIKNHEHMKALNWEKATAYGAAITALYSAYNTLPNEKSAISSCETKNEALKGNCFQVVKNNFKGILPNYGNREVLASAIMKFIAKASAAGIAINQHGKATKMLQKVNESTKASSISDSGFEDVRIERCAFNPQDPACIKPGNRISGNTTFSGGNFSIGADGSNDSINLLPEESNFGDPTSSPSVIEDKNNDDKNEVSSVNSPFLDEVKEAHKILNPAAAAQTQATGGAGSGSPGGAGGSMGSGSASLGNDLEGPSPDANKTSEIKAGKVSGMYGQAKGGEGFKGVGKSNSKDEGNPFSSLFEQKDQEGGGIEEDRSIASEDIDLKSLDLFQKISKRYNQVHLDKRIEAKNLDD